MEQRDPLSVSLVARGEYAVDVDDGEVTVSMTPAAARAVARALGELASSFVTDLLVAADVAEDVLPPVSRPA